jgi:hypothetical protein
MTRAAYCTSFEPPRYLARKRHAFEPPRYLARKRHAFELARYLAGKNHAFCPRARTALGALAESAAGDFQPHRTRTEAV